ncbi:MAG TPA: NAD(P)H-dependent oxidoreductase [Candidatus Saccharimonas sp.]|nr:NAD(P)H-dependent oxidoreductase [Candidatus Saccharimonas sp.]
MDTPIIIAVIAGTTRPKRESISAARFVANVGASLPHTEIIFVDPADYHLPHDGNDEENRNPAFTELTAKADAFFIVTPEYNHSFPGSLKRLLDSEYDNYYHKPVAIAGCSNGAWGGVRAVEALTTALRGMELLVSPYSVYFPKVQDIFDASGTIKPEFAARYTKNVTHVFAELAWLSSALKNARKGV